MLNVKDFSPIIINEAQKYIRLNLGSKRKKMRAKMECIYVIRLTAGLARRFVRGKSLVPAPPPSMIAATVLGSRFSMSKSLSCT